MKILIAPDKFKGSLSAVEACDAIERGIRRFLPRATIDKAPIADGGEGTVQALVAATGGRILTRRVTGPLGKPVRARFGLLGDGDTAVIEMAAASGLSLVPRAKRNPLRTTTYGTGDLIRTALKIGVKRIILGIGGSATNDGGAGMAMALGAKLLDARGREIGWGGGELGKLDRIADCGVQIANCEILVACDVTNPLCGTKGASAVYGPQKGATPGMVRILDRNLAHFAQIVQRDVIRRRTRPPLHDLPGAGAAGGLGYGLCAFLGAKLRRGTDLVLDAVDFDRRVRGVDLVITGEGAIDEQTVHGKVPVGVARRAAKRGVAVIALGGTVPPGANSVFRHGIAGVASLCHSPTTLETAQRDAWDLLALAAERTLRLWCAGGKADRK